MENHKTQSVCFISLGCPRNVVDTEIMIGIATKHGYTIAPSHLQADFIVINTCGFLEASRQEALQTIANVIEKKKPLSKIIVTGCLVQLQDSSLDPYRKDIHYLLGSGEVEEVLEALSSKKAGSLISSKKSFLENDTTPRTLSTPPHYAYLKIAEGCCKACSYCIIPTIKGPLKSKPEKQILEEVHTLVDAGVNELILIAQDLGDWGKDLGFRGNTGLISLLKSILNIKKDFSLRLLYVYPDEITKDLVDLMASDPRILPYLDMPIQHIDDTILDLMKRRTTEKHILESIDLLRSAIPHIALRTSLIVGFPGEEESHFESLCAFVEKTHFTHLGIFSYSNEPLSASFSLPHHVPDEVKEARCRRLHSLQKKIVKRDLKKYIGKRLSVIVDGYHPETKLLMIGRHEGQCPEVDSVVIINDPSSIRAFGEKYLVEVTGISEYDLIANPIVG